MFVKIEGRHLTIPNIVLCLAHQITCCRQTWIIWNNSLLIYTLAICVSVGPVYSICECIYRELVRMRAACCILRFIRLTPSYQRHLQENCRKLLYDKDPGVMSIGVKIQLQLLKVRPISCFPFLSFKNVRNKSWRELI